MPSRLKRFGDLKTITKQSSEIIDKKANIVMLDGRVFLGKVVDITTDKLVYINTRSARCKLSLKSISEVIIDYKA